MKFTVTKLNKHIKSLIDMKKSIILEGEIANFHGSMESNMYFSLRDEASSIDCVIWRGTVLNKNFENGNNVLLEGKVLGFIRDGKYQVHVSRMDKLNTVGPIQAKFNSKKEKLINEGMVFIDKYGVIRKKNPKKIPMYPQNIALITSSKGKAVQDIRKIISGYVQHLLIESTVQGKSAPAELIKALNKANAEKDGVKADIIIITRGGGRYEDMEAFNDYELAKAIFGSPIPVVSGIGHDSDFTIVDYVVDNRFPTPTAAAYGVIHYFSKELPGEIKRNKNTLDRAMDSKINTMYTIFFRKRYNIDGNMEYKITEVERTLKETEIILECKSPENILKSGYAIVMDNDKLITSASDLDSAGDITISFYDGVSNFKVY